MIYLEVRNIQFSIMYQNADSRDTVPRKLRGLAI